MCTAREREGGATVEGGGTSCTSECVRSRGFGATPPRRAGAWSRSAKLRPLPRVTRGCEAGRAASLSLYREQLGLTPGSGASSVTVELNAFEILRHAHRPPASPDAGWR